MTTPTPDVKPSLAPSTKVTTSAVTGAAVVILVWVASMFGLDVPPEVAAAAAVVLSFGAAYAVKDR